MSDSTSPSSTPMEERSSLSLEQQAQQLPAEVSKKRRFSDGWKLFVCIVIVLVGALGSSLVQTDGGKIQVTDLKIAGKHGATVTADLFRPKDATPENKAPMVIVSPGFQRTKETQVSNSLELARRGFVTLVVDPYNQGESSSQHPDDGDTAVVTAIDYVTDHLDTFNYVDEDRIGITGHSAGGTAVRTAANKYGKKVDDALEAAKDPNSEGGTTITDGERKRAEDLDKISAVFISGWLKNLNDKKFAHVHSNMALGYARYDEGGYRNINGDGDLRDAPEALSMVNSGLKKQDQVDRIEIGRGYGDIDKGTYRVAYNDETLHPLQPLTPSAIGSILEFFDDTLDAPVKMDSGNQTWWLKEVFNLISLIGGIAMLFPLTRMLLRTRYFAPVAQALPTVPKRPRGKEAAKFWAFFVLSAAIAFFTFMPLANLSQDVFYDAANKVSTWFFPARMVNSVVLWAIVNGIVGLILFYITRDKSTYARGERARAWGITMSWRTFWRTLLLAFILLFVYFSVLSIVYLAFHSDYRFLVVASRPLTLRWFLVALMYVPAMFIFYLANSIRAGVGTRYSDTPKWQTYLIAALANSVGLAMIFVIQYSVFAATGTVHWTDDWLYVNMLQSILPMMILLPILNKMFYANTGRVWLGPLVIAPIFITMSLGGSVAYIPSLA